MSSPPAPTKTSTWIGFINPFVKFAQPTIGASYVTATNPVQTIEDIKTSAGSSSPDALGLFIKYGKSLSLLQAKITCGACDFAAVVKIPKDTTQGEVADSIAANRYTIAWSQRGIVTSEYAQYGVNIIGTGTTNKFTCYISKDLLTYQTDPDPEKQKVYENEALATGDNIANMLAIMGCPDGIYVDVSGSVIGISCLGALYASFGVPYSVNYMIAVPLTVTVGRIVVADNDVAGWEAKMALGMAISKTTITIIQCSIPQQIGFQAKIREYAEGTITDRAKIDWFWDVPRLYSQHLQSMDNRPNYFVTITTFADFVACVLYLNTYITRFSQVQSFIAQPRFKGDYDEAVKYYEDRIAQGARRTEDAKILNDYVKGLKPEDLTNVTMHDLNVLLPPGSPYEQSAYFQNIYNTGKPNSYARQYAAQVMLRSPVYIFNMGWWETWFDEGFDYFSKVAAKTVNPGTAMPTRQNVSNAIKYGDWLLLYKMLRQIIVPTANAIDKAHHEEFQSQQKALPKRKKAGNASVLIRKEAAPIPEDFFKDKKIYKRAIDELAVSDSEENAGVNMSELPRHKALQRKFVRFNPQVQTEGEKAAAGDEEAAEVEPEEVIQEEPMPEAAPLKRAGPSSPKPSTGGTVKKLKKPTIAGKGPVGEARAKKSLFTTGDRYNMIKQTVPAHNVLAKGDKGMIINVHEAGYYRPYLLQWNDAHGDHVVKDQITNKSILQHAKQHGLSLTDHGATLVT